MKDQTLTFCVSGLLWNRSLVMMDTETESLWSHLLGECMQGRLKGSQLESIPSEMVTWAEWKKQHPTTTVINLSRTRNEYTKDIYKNPADFVFGWEVDGKTYSSSFADLLQHPVQSVTAGKSPLVVTYDSNSTAARLFSRRLDGKVLTFAADKPGFLRDQETGTLWNLSGLAVEGQLKGQRLETQVGIVSFARAWKTFHPDSQDIGDTK